MYFFVIIQMYNIAVHYADFFLEVGGRIHCIVGQKAEMTFAKR